MWHLVVEEFPEGHISDGTGGQQGLIRSNLLIEKFFSKVIERDIIPFNHAEFNG